MPPIPFWVIRRIVLGLIAATALAVVTVVELRSSGGLPDWALVLLAIIVGLLGPAESIVRTIRDWFGHVGFEQRLDVEEAAKGAIIALTKVAPELSWTQVGITVFVVTRAHWHLIHGIQERIVRIRIESTPRPSTVLWTRKKGILGKCWREERDSYLDHRQFYGQYMDITEKQWDALGDDIRMGLTFRDFKDIRGYGLVLASPMKDRHGYRGCFVVQVPSEVGPNLLTDDAKEVIHTFAATVCAVLK